MVTEWLEWNLKPLIPAGALMSPPDTDLTIRVAMLEDWARELGVELRDHELRLRELSHKAKADT